MNKEKSSDLLSLSNETCLICAEFLSPTTRIPAITSCDHSGVCSICFLRLRYILRDFTCPQCKQNCEQVICCYDSNSKFNDFEIWGDQAPGFIYDNSARMFFPPDNYKLSVEPLKKSICKICGVVKRDEKALKGHLYAEHKLMMCSLCLEFKHSFPSEHKVYSQIEYENHLRKGDNDGSEGHPNCEFCKRRYYDKTALFVHLQRDHFSCHICEREGIQFKYYSDYSSLEDHFRSDHILCEVKSCLEKKFVVFSNEIDYNSHLVNYHPHLAGNHKSISIQFGSRRKRIPRESRFMEDSSQNDLVHTRGSTSASASASSSSSSSLIFDGGVSGRAENGEWQIELPITARDPREGNRTALGMTPDISYYGTGAPIITEEFPTLSSVEDTNRRNTGQLIADDFPLLEPPKIPTNWGGGFKVDKRLGSSKQKVVVSNKNQNSKASIAVWKGPASKNKPDDYQADYPHPAQISSNLTLLNGKFSQDNSAKQYSIVPDPNSKQSITNDLDLGPNIRINYKQSNSKVKLSSSSEIKSTQEIKELSDGLTITENIKKEQKQGSQMKKKTSSNELNKVLSSLGLNSKSNKSNQKPQGISGIIPAKSSSSIAQQKSSLVSNDSSSIASMISVFKNDLKRPPSNQFQVATNIMADSYQNNTPKSNSSNVWGLPPPPPGFDLTSTKNVEASTNHLHINKKPSEPSLRDLAILQPAKKK